MDAVAVVRKLALALLLAAIGSFDRQAGNPT
jgi:hypothetical protein